MVDSDIFDYNYTDFDDKNIQRVSVRQQLFDKDNRHYRYIQEVQEKLKQEGKYIATEENTFWAILDWFEWSEEQKIKAMQFLTGFVGHWIISLEKDTKGCRRLLQSLRYKHNTNTYDSNNTYAYGSLFVAKDC